MTSIRTLQYAAGCYFSSFERGAVNLHSPLHDVYSESKRKFPEFSLQQFLNRASLSDIDQCLLGLTKELADYSFHIIINYQELEIAGINASRGVLEEVELEIQPLDIRKNRELILQAIQNQAFVAMTKLNSEESKISLRFASKWTEMIQKGGVKQLNLKNDAGKIIDTYQLNETKLSSFTAEEVDHFSQVIFKALMIASQIQSLRNQRKVIEKQLRKDQEDFDERKKHQEDAFRVELEKIKHKGYQNHRAFLRELELLCQLIFKSFRNQESFIK